MNSRVEKRVFLIVEDNDIVRALTRDLIDTNFPESTIIEAANAAEGISLAISKRPDIILMDICLPKIDGIKATERIVSGLPEAKIIILSVHEDQEYEANATAAGASAFMLKRKMVVDLVPLVTDLLS